jgi:predicted nucleic acid-binding protein
VIAADTNTWIAYLEGNEGPDTQLLDRALEDRQVLMVPAVLTELLSDPKPFADIRPILASVPLIEIRSGYWERAGRLRAKVLAKGRKARLGDALIAQTCMDRGISLITRDRDFQAFAEAAGLRIVEPDARRQS